jgi:hypothetical protein
MHACMKQSYQHILKIDISWICRELLKLCDFGKGYFCKYHMCNNIFILVTRQNIVLHKANFIYRMNRATCQSLEFVNLTSEQILILETHIVYETYIVWTYIVFSWPKEYVYRILHCIRISCIVMGNLGTGIPINWHPWIGMFAETANVRLPTKEKKLPFSITRLQKTNRSFPYSTYISIYWNGSIYVHAALSNWNRSQDNSI